MELEDIPARLKTLNRSQAELARHLELDPSSLTKTLKRLRRVQPDEKLKIEAFFGEKLSLDITAPATPRRKAGLLKIPVYGYAAAGGEDRIAYAENTVLDYFDPPPFWSGAGDLIYVRLVGESMVPRYFSGEVLPVRLNVPPARDTDCLIEFHDNTALVKTYKGMRDGKLFAMQYNEMRELAFEASRVRALHSVWRPGML